MEGDRAGPGDARTTFRKLQHDLRTRVGQILGYSEMLEEELADREIWELLPDLAHIRKAATTLLELVDGVFQAEPAAVVVSEPVGEPTPGTAQQRGGHSGRLLLVDDEPVNRDLLGRQLARAGDQVTEADGGRPPWRRSRRRPSTSCSLT